jgi:predicted metal-dependent hydrolase
MKAKILKIHNTEIKFKKSLKAKNLSISIKPFIGVVVTVPIFFSYSTAEDFVLKKIEWIKKNHLKMVQKEKSHTIFDFSTKFNTRNHIILIKPTINDDFSTQNIKNKIIISIPETKNILSSASQTYIRNIIVKTWRKEAQQFLPLRINELANQFNLKFQKISVRNTKSRWGSCSYKNNISLSLHLMRIPDKLIDYVILHELTHTIVKNHSNVFWETLEKVCENSKQLDRELKNYNLSIF